MQQKQYNLAVCRFPGNNSEHPASSSWVMKHILAWDKDPRIGKVIPLRKSDTPIDMVRNLLVKKALAEGADYILMIDQDMGPDSESDGLPFWDTSWDFMMQRREEEEDHREECGMRAGWSYGMVEEDCFELFPPATIAAPYCGPPPDEVVYVLHYNHAESNTPDFPRPFSLGLFARDQAAQFSGIFSVAALPTGLILYDARVFKKLEQVGMLPWFAYEYADPPYNTRKASTEDVFQTRNAAMLNMPQFCNWDAWATHWKYKGVRKPRVLCTKDIGAAFADALVKNHRSDHKVVIVRSEDDVPSR